MLCVCILRNICYPSTCINMHALKKSSRLLSAKHASPPGVLSLQGSLSTNRMKSDDDPSPGHLTFLFYHLACLLFVFCFCCFLQLLSIINNYYGGASSCCSNIIGSCSGTGSATNNIRRPCSTSSGYSIISLSLSFPPHIVACNYIRKFKDWAF